MSTSRIENYGVEEYKIFIKDGGVIEFNTGSGTVVINGDLDVNGSTTSITSSELIISDKTLTINNQSTTEITIVGATQTDPITITTADPHTFIDGSLIQIRFVIGMTELNNNSYYISVVDTTSFRLYSDIGRTISVNGTGFTAYSAGGTARRVPANGVGGDGISGIIIDRGNFSDAHMLYDENLETWKNGNLEPQIGAFYFGLANGDLAGIYATSIIANDGNDLMLLPGSTSGVVSVSQTIDYEKRIFPYTGSNINTNISNPDRLANPTDDDYIPNIKAVKDYIRDYHKYNWQYRINAPEPDGNTKVEVFSTSDGFPVSKAEITVNGSSIAEFFQTYAQIGLTTITNSTIAPVQLNSDLVLTANGTGSIRIPDPVHLTKDTDPTAPVDGVKLYSKAEGDGGTGLYFINENATNDEIISRNKALLYSIIF